MSITSGAYTIRSAIQPNLFMGVQFNKGNQSKDMKVVSIREERKDRKDPHKWDIRKVGKDEYFLTMRGAAAVIIKDEVYASKEREHETWEIKHVPEFGKKNEYIIMRDERDEKKKKKSRTGWKLPSPKPNTQVAIRNLTGFQSNPPKFPASERFIIESLNNLD